MLPAALRARINPKTWGRGLAHMGQIIGYRKDGRPVRLIGGASGPAVVQHAANKAVFSSGTSGAVTVTLGGNATAGNSLVACIGAVGVAGTMSVSSVKTATNAENWASAAVLSDASTNFVLSAIWADPGTAGGQDTVVVTVAFGGSATSSEQVAVLADVYEVSGVVSTSVVDKTANSGTGQSGSSWSTGTTATTGQPSEIAFGSVAGRCSASLTLTPSSSWTNSATVSQALSLVISYNAYQQSGYQVLNAQGTASYTGTSTTSFNYDGVVVTLKAVTSEAGAAALPAGSSLTGGGDLAGSAAVAAAGSLTAQGDIEGGSTMGATSSLTAGALVSSALAELAASSTLAAAPGLGASAALAALAALTGSGGQPGSAEMDAHSAITAEPAAGSVYTTCFQKAPDYLDVTGANQ